MDAFEILCREVESVAEAHGMDVRVVGEKGWVPATDDHNEYFEDSRLLKLTPTGVPTRLLLEVEYSGGLRLYRHRNSNLTSQFKGKRITKEWVFEFIKKNAELAESIRRDQPSPEPEPEPIKPEPLSAEEVANRRAERNSVACLCEGRNENCARCYGTGTYKVDGFGKPVKA